MAKDGKRGLTSDQWVEVRAAYEAGASILGLSQKWGVARTTIIAHRDTEAWTIQPQPTGVGPSLADRRRVRDQTQAKVIDLASRRAVEVMTQTGQIDSLAKVLGRHAQLSIKLTDVMDLYLDMAVGKIPVDENGERINLVPPSEKQNHFDVLNALVSAFKNAIAATRDAGGLRPGQSSDSVGSTEADEPTTIVRQIVSARESGVG